MTNPKKNVPELRFPEFEKSWRIITLGEATTKIGSGKTPLGGSSVYLNNGIPFLRSQNIQYGILDLSELVYIDENTDENMKSSRTYYGDILLNITGASIGRSAVNTIKKGYANLNQHVCIIRLKEHYNYNFIGQFLISPKGQKKIFMAQSGGSREGLNFNEISKIKFSLPDEVEEQQKIGDFFSKLDRQIELEEQKLALLEEQKKGYMQKIFSQELRFKDDNGNEYPEWEEKKIEEMARKIQSGGTPKTSIAEYWNGELPWIQSSDLIKGRITGVTFNKYITTEGLEQSSAKRIPAHSIAIVTRVGVGKIAMVNKEFSTSQDFLNLSELNIDSYFALYRLYILLEKEASSLQGTSIKGITKNDLISKVVKIPRIREEQQKIGDFFSKLDRQIELQEQKIERLKQRKQGFLQKMFV